MTGASSSSIDDADVHAFADGRLAGPRADQVSAAIARDPTLAARVAYIRQQNAELRAALDPMLSEPIPQRLLDAASAPHATGRTRAARWWPPIAAAASLVVGAALGWFGRGLDLEREGTPVTFARQAAIAHALYATDVNRPVEVWAAEEKRLVTWLTRRLGYAVTTPDLNSMGYALVGGRLVAGNERPTALFMYENADRQRLSLQVRKHGEMHGDTAFRYAVENGVGVFYWIDDACSYALSGNIDRGQLLAIARLVYGQLAAAELARR